MSQSKYRKRSEPEGACGQPDPSPGRALDIWDLALDELRHQMAAGTFQLHLSGSRPRAWQPEDNTWVIEVRSTHSPAWLKHRLGRVVRRVLARHTPGLPEPRLVYLAPEPVGTPGARASAVPAHLPATRADAVPLDDQPPTTTAGPESRSSKPPRGGAAKRGARSVPGDGAEKPDSRHAAAESGAGRPDTAAWKARLQPTDIYIKVKTSFRDRALRRLKGAKLSVFMSLALHMDADGTAAPGIERIMRETGLARGTVCRALDDLGSPPLSLIEKVPVPQDKRPRGCIRMPNCYKILGYAWWGAKPAPALYEEETALE
jgi:hypothetical protein